MGQMILMLSVLLRSTTQKLTGFVLVADMFVLSSIGSELNRLKVTLPVDGSSSTVTVSFFFRVTEPLFLQLSLTAECENIDPSVLNR